MIYQLRDIQQVYDGRSVLRIESLDISENEILAIVGPSGAGKSTLLRLLAKLEAPTQGQVKLNIKGQNFDHTDLPIAIRRQIAMVFQRPILLSRSVRDNITYGLKIRGEHHNEAIIDDVMLQLKIQHLSNAKANTLSGGEAQRVAIARTLVLDPTILILDEPTVNLDPYNIGLIENLLLAHHHQHSNTIIIVTHNIYQAKRLATKMMLLYDGDCVEIADTRTFFENPTDDRTRAFTTGQLIY